VVGMVVFQPYEPYLSSGRIQVVGDIAGNRAI